MNIASWMSAVFLGMGMQAAIAAALFPDGIDPDQQLSAAVIFGALAVVFGVLGVVLNQRDRR